MRIPFLLAFLCVSTSLFSQYAISEIPGDIKNDVYAVVRNQETLITIHDYDKIEIYTKEIISVLNRKGLEALNLAVGYDKSSSIKAIEAKVFDAKGKEIEKFKKRDFHDVSATGSNLYSDNRMMYIEYTPRSYPFTIEFIVEEASSSTAFLPRWTPTSYTNVSVERSTFTIDNPKQVPLISKKFNLENYDVSIVETPTKYEYTLKNLEKLPKEPLAPHYTQFLPMAKVALQKFQLENERAYIKTWKDFGLWQKNSLLKGRDKISDGTKATIEQLVAGVEDPKEKARIIYEYMQGKTRYISVQVGIGGWQPSPAKDVDELSYGDCKALTNYTMALLKSQGIESYYTIVEAGENGRGLDEDFVALQGNHVILAVPFEDENVFLECTSQKAPFNYMGDFTDDREVLMVTPEGGVITKTHAYLTEDNKQTLTATASLSGDLILTGLMKQMSEGVPYGDVSWLDDATNDDVVMHYKESYGHLNNLSLANIKFENDKRAIVFTENLNFETSNYSSAAGDRILFNPNIFTRFKYLPPKDDNRLLPVHIRRGKSYNDTIEIQLPEGISVEALFDEIEIVSKYGTYHASITPVTGSKLKYHRNFVLNAGTYKKEEYDDFVAFIQRIVKKDKSKIVLKGS
ncbi:DUF3857 domain-containing protein [Rasiella rasia]|uniref:DUF3857 domain-containing protein n=1 Tax=Rasiella rasia TaxID=2744027 RepID=A0A6G6GP91_9FLAO|nr:DUF3857 domain-containing transglutaminase family protein [Rasiella rasia]QIE60368.1 DUF3857 domain-containing protein [Rasiella rasia]